MKAHFVNFSLDDHIGQCTGYTRIQRLMHVAIKDDAACDLQTFSEEACSLAFESIVKAKNYKLFQKYSVYFSSRSDLTLPQGWELLARQEDESNLEMLKMKLAEHKKKDVVEIIRVCFSKKMT